MINAHSFQSIVLNSNSGYGIINIQKVVPRIKSQIRGLPSTRTSTKKHFFFLISDYSKKIYPNMCKVTFFK